MWNGEQYVSIPYLLDLPKQSLQYKDILTYVALRSFDNDKNECFPRHDTIALRAGMSRKYIIQSITRLELSNLITVKRSKKQRESNYYFFNEIVAPTKLPVGFFSITDLTCTEKGILLCIRQFFNTGDFKCSYDLDQMAKLLGLTYQQVYKPFKSLISKGYIIEKSTVSKNADKCVLRRYLNTKLIDWSFGGEPLIPEIREKMVLKPSEDRTGWVVPKRKEVEIKTKCYLLVS